MKKFILLLLFLISIFCIFPKIGLYSYLFDKKNYDYINQSSVEAISDLKQLSPKTEEVAKEFLKECKIKGISVQITETYQTEYRNNYNMQANNRDSDMICSEKKHMEGRAFDICKLNTNTPYGDIEFFRRCAEIGKKVGLSPGFYSKDKSIVHFELNRWWLP
ncbi:hypothetical protein [Anaerosphaera multitolerans]|uniref:Peptidase M15 n=1 Tax=Anaerosphaera multitolerans TaxID=2487351 RepID=A0A437S589_9FIRM|nr:hypothetical protein [Anaerosphaera multitolerans]RVU54195.1 hypothetical protein EF514_08410 [Anaerosphaera multitolerans]